MINSTGQSTGASGVKACEINLLTSGEDDVARHERKNSEALQKDKFKGSEILVIFPHQMFSYFNCFYYNLKLLAPVVINQVFADFSNYLIYSPN